MSWAKLDDRFHDNRKVRRAWLNYPPAVGLYVMALTYCAQHETDGRVDGEFVLVNMPAKRERERMTSALVDAGLWALSEDGWLVCNYLEFNPSRSDLDEKRRKDADRKARGRNSPTRPTNVHADSTRTPNGLQAESAWSPLSVQPESARPDPTRPLSPPTPQGEEAVGAVNLRPAATDVRKVFDTWQESKAAQSGHKQTAVLDEPRRKQIQRALRNHSLDDVLAAVQGWRKSPHHRGENDTATVYNDLELLLRNAGHIEKFRDLHNGKNGAGSTKPPTAAEMVAASDAARDRLRREYDARHTNGDPAA